MWWLDPGKEILNVVFNRILAPYVVNLDMNQVSYGIGQGELTLQNLKLKRGALDKFRLPVDVLEGHLGRFTLSLHWVNLGNLPVQVLIEDVYLLVVPSSQSRYDPDEEEARAQAAKAERLENAELLHMRGQAEQVAGDKSPETQGLIASLIAKVLNNLQVTVKNVHVRYEDNISSPGHPFSGGLTLAGFTARSVNEKWEPAFLESTVGTVRKLAELQSLALYFDTDSPSLSGISHSEFIRKFHEMISQGTEDKGHQFILKPVSGQGRVAINHRQDENTPQFDIQLLFKEIAIGLDHEQYQDLILLGEMFHVFARQHQYRKYRPADDVFAQSAARGRLMYAGTAVLETVRERKRTWSWEYFAERRDDRLKYVELFIKKISGTASASDLEQIKALDRKLAYEDIRFYRSVAHSRLRKDNALRQRLQEEKQKTSAQQRSSWGSWLWGSSNSQPSSSEAFLDGNMSEQQRKELYAVLEYDEKVATANALQGSRAMKFHISASLQKGSMALRANPKDDTKDILTVVFDGFQANVLQRSDNFEAAVSLGSFGVIEGTTTNTLHPQIVQVKGSSEVKEDDPFFYLKFEKNPLDERADSALTVKMRHMEIVYHRGYVEAIQRFFRPPESRLESLEALLSVASQTLDEFTRETRAGLEFVLQNHKTIDIQLDMNAPIIIIPEDVTNEESNHLIIDAGHIAVESELADQDTIRSLQAKRSQQFSDEDYKQLEASMYDKFSLKLTDAQFVIGHNLEACRKALVSEKTDTLHLIERISVDFLIHNSIIPKVAILPRFKVSGHLPSLHINFSDAKYKSLMRLIDVAIPQFDEDSSSSDTVPQRPPLSLGPRVFSQEGQEYHVIDDEANDPQVIASESKEDVFYEANEGIPDKPQLHQHIFELEFEVDELSASISKSLQGDVSQYIGSVSLGQFSLNFVLEKFAMQVDVTLRSLSMDLAQPSAQPMRFITSDGLESPNKKDLLQVAYKRAQKESPEFLTTYEGIDQSVDVTISTFAFHASPEPVLNLYDFIMTTFTTPDTSAPQKLDNAAATQESTAQSTAESKIRVQVHLASVELYLVNEATCFAKLSMSTANVIVLLRPRTIRVSGRLGSLSLENQSDTFAVRPEFSHVLSIEGENFADFNYQTFDPEEENYKGINSLVALNAASLKLNFLEKPLHDIYLFLVKLGQLKGLYDSARQAAVQKASDINQMQFQISVKTPIIVVPSDPASSLDKLVLRLGEINAHNTATLPSDHIEASLRGIQLASTFHHDEGPSTLKIIDDIDVTTDIVQTSGADRSEERETPDFKIRVDISDIRLQLTEAQYIILIQLSQSIPRVLAGAPEGVTQANVVLGSPPADERTESDPSASGQSDFLADQEPEIQNENSVSWVGMDVTVAAPAMNLRMYDATATSEASLKNHGIARFALEGTQLSLKSYSDGASEINLGMKSLTMRNTRPGNTRFREIIPASKDTSDQFHALYTTSGGAKNQAMAIVTINSPDIVFAVDPVFALIGFFRSAFPGQAQAQTQEMSQKTASENQPQSSIDYRVDLLDLSVCVLEDDSDPESQAIELTVQDVLLSQQSILALTITRLGMALKRMNHDSDNVQFMDEVDLNFTMDSRTSSSQSLVSIDASLRPVVVRASYQDVHLITTIVNKALELSKSIAPTEPSDQEAVSSQRQQSSTTSRNRVPDAQVVISKEQLKANFEGFRLVLIGDLQEQPMLHLSVRPFTVDAKDWSGELHAGTTLATQIRYWNLANSHWEPLIDPWTFTVDMGKTGATGALNMKVSSRECLDVNISAAFAEFALTASKMWGDASRHTLPTARGSYAPYRIKNRTGSTISVWTDGSDHQNSFESAKSIPHDQSLDWRFEDWRSVREHVGSTNQHTIGVHFEGKAWERLRAIPVDREGEYVFSMRPRTEEYTTRLLCEVKVVDNVKEIVFRSTYRIENQTFYPLELTLVDDGGHPVYSMEKIQPGQDYSLPLEAVFRTRVRIQPDQGFGYKWCPAIRWDDLVARKGFTIRCPHSNPTETAFRFQAWVQTSVSTADAQSRNYPKINMKLRAPLEIENLLPYNIQYRVYDKEIDQNWRSYLRKGGITPVHSVELGHLVMLSVEVDETVFQPSDFAIISTEHNSTFPRENQLKLKDARGRELRLQLNYVRDPDAGGAVKVQIYSPYVVVNKTGLPFGLRSTRATRSARDVAGDDTPEVLSQPTPFMISHQSDNGKEFIIKAGESNWSKPFSLEAPTAETTLVIPSEQRRMEELHLGISWAPGSGKYKMTKVMTLSPRFLVSNHLDESISFREVRGEPRLRGDLKPGDRAPLLYMRAEPEKLLTVAISGLNAQWSAPINIEDIGVVHARLQSSKAKAIQLIRAEIKLDGPTIFVSLHSAQDDWPFLIENTSDFEISVQQNHNENDPSAKQFTVYPVKSKTSLPYAWDFPAAKVRDIRLVINGSRRIVDVKEIGDLIPFKFKDGTRTRAVSLDVRADGQQQVLRVSNYNPDNSLYKPRGGKARPGPARQDSIASTSEEAFEAVTEEFHPTMTFAVNFSGIGVSLVNRTLLEVLYVTINNFSFEYANSETAQSVNMALGQLQIDNQLHDAIYPVILQPTPFTREAGGASPPPTVQTSVVWLKDEAHGVVFIKYLSILLQALTIEVDEDLLYNLFELSQLQGVSWEDPAADILVVNPTDIPEPKAAVAGPNLYFEVLELQPVKLMLSFMRTERSDNGGKDNKMSVRNPLAVVIHALTMTLGNINDARLELNALAIKDMRLTMDDLQNRIAFHYRQEVLRQVYRILGSADFIGNPVGLFTNVSSGVADIFYEPFNGVVMHGNKELGVGIAKGAASFAKKTIFGFSDSMMKFTSSVGKGLSSATFDSEYQAQRRLNQRRNKPRHAIYGFTSGGEAFATSMASAVEGVLIKPIEGAESEGAVGFFKGVGKGFAGIVTKPVVGAFDFAANVTEGIRNTTTVFDKPDRDRRRMPRLVPSDGVLQPYSEREALGQYWMRDLNNGSFRSEFYVAHINTPGSDNVVLVTASRVMSFWSKRLRLEWDLPLYLMAGVTVEDTGIRFGAKAGKQSDKFVFIPDKSSRAWFFDKVAGVIKTHNSQKKLMH